MIDEDATVVKRLDKAGAVLVAKLTLGALAMGDVWFGGVTRNPWNTNQGSSGSSAGPASGNRGGMRGIQHRVRNARLDFVTIDGAAVARIAAVVRSSAENGRDGAFLEHG